MIQKQVEQPQSEKEQEKFESTVIQLTVYAINDDERGVERILKDSSDDDLDGILYFYAAMIRDVINEKERRRHPIKNNKPKAIDTPE